MTAWTWATAAAAALALIAAPAHAQSLNTNASGTFGQVSLDSGFTPDPYSVTVAAGGPVDATRADEDCNASYLPSRPSFSLRYDNGDFPTLFIGATSEADTTIAVRAPNGQWFCDDDSGGDLNPLVSIEAPRSGRYQIYVGRFFVEGETAPAMLHISEVGGPAQAAGGMPDFSLEPAYGVVDLVSGFTPDPHTIEIAAGGSIDASVINQPGCVGHIAEAPDYRLSWTAGSGALPLIFSVASDSDTTLVINDPHGNWVCDDDGGDGLNPSITFAAPEGGQYDIWVGTYAEGELQSSTLHISEIASQ
jgi:hypothetical protein